MTEAGTCSPARDSGEIVAGEVQEVGGEDEAGEEDEEDQEVQEDQEDERDEKEKEDEKEGEEDEDEEEEKEEVAAPPISRCHICQWIFDAVGHGATASVPGGQDCPCNKGRGSSMVSRSTRTSMRRTSRSEQERAGDEDLPRRGGRDRVADARAGPSEAQPLRAEQLKTPRSLL